jgi:predicted dehydrogenase
VVASHRIRVGVIGANPERGWALTAHIPALKALPQYEITAVSSTRRDSAQQVATKFRIGAAFDSHEALVNHADVDLVVVTVRVPMHWELVSAALLARKNVYCEWPLGNGLAEAQAMAALAKSQRVRAFVGLQARFSPAVRYMRRLVSEGFVGRVLSTSIVASGMAWGGAHDVDSAYLNDKRNGATLLSIPFAHTIDALSWVLGEMRQGVAFIANQVTETTDLQTGSVAPKSAEDQLIVAGALQSGATVCVHYRGGRSRGTQFVWEINGTEGDLLLTAPNGHLQLSEPELSGARGSERALQPMPVPDEYRWVPVAVLPGPQFNVAQAYVRLAEDLRTGTREVATFDHAVDRHRMLEAVRAAAMSGRRASFDFNG